MGQASSGLDSLDTSPIEVDKTTLEWLHDHQISTEVLVAPADAHAQRLSALRAELPCWLGGAVTAEECCRRSILPMVNSSDADALRDCLTLLERGQSGSSRSGAYRRTIYTKSKNVGVGEDVAVVHVYEVLPPLSWHEALYQMGPKLILGEYVDGVLHAVRPAGDPVQLEEAGEVFAVYDTDSTGELSLEQLWEALGQLHMRGLLSPTSRAAGGGSDPAVAQPLSEWHRTQLRHIAGGDRLDRPGFTRLVGNLLGRGGYDGAVDAGPGIDTSWEVTRYRFDTPGEHLISWHGLEHFAGCAPSNVLRINVMPKLPHLQPGASLAATEPALAFRGEGGRGRSHIEIKAPATATAAPVAHVHPLRKFHCKCECECEVGRGAVLSVGGGTVSQPVSHYVHAHVRA